MHGERRIRHEEPAIAGAELAVAQRELQELRAQLAATIAAKTQIQDALDLRNAALDASTTHFMIVDMRQHGQPIIYANRAFATQYGYGSPEELIGHSATAIFDNIADDIREAAGRTLMRGDTSKMEVEVARRDGTRFWVGLTTTPLRDAQGAITHLATLGADITARRERDRNERELQQQLVNEMRERERMSIELQLAHKLESVGRLAAGLAHEINTPIQYVGDNVHFLRSAFDDLTSLFQAYRAAVAEPVGAESLEARVVRFRQLEAAADLDFLSQEVPKAFERALEGAQRVASLVRAMKEFAYPDAAEHLPADLNQALKTTLTVARNEYKYAASVNVELAEIPQVACNIGELNQVFLNLVVNAAHAIQDSGKDVATGCITVATRAVGETVEISIADNGCGIPAENLGKIFDPFYTTKEVGRGTGQGLAIARSIVVDRHRGRIDVSSTPGVGTAFTVCLPVSRPAAEAT
jgi:PAS domain S-box-containing protein